MASWLPFSWCQPAFLGSEKASWGRRRLAASTATIVQNVYIDCNGDLGGVKSKSVDLAVLLNRGDTRGGFPTVPGSVAGRRLAIRIGWSRNYLDDSILCGKPS